MLSTFITYLILSMLLSYGMSVLLVEKGKEWPIKPWKIRIKYILSKIHKKMPDMLECVTCTSFWATFFSDIVFLIISIHFGQFYFFWPFSGIIVSGATWTIIEFIATLNKETDINIYIDGEQK